MCPLFHKFCDLGDFVKITANVLNLKLFLVYYLVHKQKCQY